MIPEDAVAAAVQRSWHLEITTSDVREILEAAAPHMLLEAWQAGKESGYRDAYTDEAEEEPNPYRPTP